MTATLLTHQEELRATVYPFREMLRGRDDSYVPTMADVKATMSTIRGLGFEIDETLWAAPARSYGGGGGGGGGIRPAA